MRTTCFPRTIFLVIYCSLAIQSVMAATIVQQFKPILPTTSNAVSGSCWTGSIAVNRPDAWRCMVGNRIFDPCFTTTDKNKLVCVPDPIANKSGILLVLNKPLPKTNNVDRKDNIHPWIIKLADGSICRSYTGTSPVTDKDILISYYCTGGKNTFGKKCGTGLIMSSLKTNKTWTVQKVIYCPSKQSQTGLAVKDIRTIAIDNVWN